MRGFNLKRHPGLTFEEVFDAYKQQVYTQVYAIAKSHYAAEEITQEIFIKLWMNEDALKDVTNLGGYIYTITRNYALNYLRKAASDTRLVNELMRVAVTDHNNTEASMAISECKQLISTAVNNLSPQRQLVYKLSKEDGLNYDEIAEHLNLSKHTVKNHLMAALSFINTYLSKNGVNPTIALIFSGILLF
ncbi:RNA polymerase sigma-70 factor [Mucilaginibacter pallidiroseus]|uniref:RNA polymerase sigma-70 factor n=1 Tax=Mucilaginibacter pallidiroseus TaxID=2599295 RepID=A0A563UCV8_9SPHI|nr:RNA polymerase sigma-70 factor [Mucilaginibacter pallidiroseus]TWR29185.1 RNA polymerase sigma-70 factor [Mucilaginibacter pallidiroseus]